MSLAWHCSLVLLQHVTHSMHRYVLKYTFMRLWLLVCIAVVCFKLPQVFGHIFFSMRGLIWLVWHVPTMYLVRCALSFTVIQALMHEATALLSESYDFILELWLYTNWYWCSLVSDFFCCRRLVVVTKSLWASLSSKVGHSASSCCFILSSPCYSIHNVALCLPFLYWLACIIELLLVSVLLPLPCQYLVCVCLFVLASMTGW